MGNNFQVELGGIVQLLSHHLYSSPRVYLRELVQNGIDAIVSRADTDPAADRCIRVTPSDVAADGRMSVADTGCGLTREGIETFLSTIGRSSKRDELGRARSDLLGQFGIGLLSAFMVTDELEVVTRAAGSATQHWRGRADGTYEVDDAAEERAQTGTTVSFHPRADAASLTTTGHARAMLREFARFLPCRIELVTDDGVEVITDAPLPWEDPTLDAGGREAAARELCRDVLGFEPMAVIGLTDEPSGTRGYAFVLPTAAQRATHRVYVKRMLLSEACTEVLPEWAFFVRAVLDVSGLTPTADREGLYEDAALAGARERLGAQIQSWLTRLAAEDPGRMHELLHCHSLGMKAMAVQDDAMLDLVARWMVVETTLGTMTWDDFLALGPTSTYVDSADEFAQILPVAASLGMPVLNGGYAYDVELLRRLRDRRGLDSKRLAAADLVGRLAEVSAADDARYRSVIGTAQRVLARAGVKVVLRSFGPETLAAMIVKDHASRAEAQRADAEAASDAVWAELLGSVARADARPWFVLNAANPTVALLPGLAEPLLEDVVEALYAHALVLGHHFLRPFDTALMARALPALIQRSIHGQEHR